MNSKENKLLKKYYDSRSACQVLGSLMCNPMLVKSLDYSLDKEDFVGAIHKALYVCIYNLSNQGLKTIDLSDIENYMHNVDPVGYVKMFEKYNGEEWIVNIIEDANVENFDYYYKVVRKYALLRNYIKNGIEVSEILDLNDMDTEKQQIQLESFDKLDIGDIIKFFDWKNLEGKQRFTVRDGNKSRKAGDNARELRELLKQTPNYGFSFESEYLTTVTQGMVGGRFMVESRDSGMGKSRSAIKRLVNICSPEIWSFEEQRYIENPNGVDNSGLYIGTEMDVFTEIEPMMWAFISGLDETRIKNNELTDEEELRLDKAIEIAERTKIFLEDEEDFDCAFLWQIIEQHKLENNISIVAVDYIELGGAMTTEYVSAHKGMTAREDQVLLNLSKNLKSMSKNFNVFIFAYTQTNDEGRRQEARDQTAVKGGKSIPNKADFGMTSFEPTKKELELLEPLIKKSNKGLGKKIIPNICYTTYKNRWFNPKKVKIWGYQNLGNMEYIDLFCTNEYYEPINIAKTKIENGY